MGMQLLFQFEYKLKYIEKIDQLVLSGVGDLKAMIHFDLNEYLSAG
jgi:hypothetical protein